MENLEESDKITVGAILQFNQCKIYWRLDFMFCNKECEHIEHCQLNKLVTDIMDLLHEHSVIETIYNDVLEHIDSDIPLTSCLNQWQEYVVKNGMSFDDFINNIVIAILSELFADVTLKKKHKFTSVSDRKISDTQKKIINVREKSYCEDSQKFLTQTSVRKSSPLYITEFCLSLNEELIGYESKGKSPLLKLALGTNMNLKHFFIKDIQELIDYYKNICNYLESGEIEEFEKIMVMYHLDIELRFLTFFKFLKLASTKHDLDKTIFDIARGLSRHSKYVMRDGIAQICSFQNIVYYGIDQYISNISHCCINELHNECVCIINSLYSIIQSIYVIRDTIFNNIKKMYNYDKYVNDLYHFLNDLLFNIKQKKAVDFCLNENKYKYKPLDMICLKMIHKYNDDFNEYFTLNVLDITLDYFVRMYVPADKYDDFLSADIKKRETRKKKRQNNQ